MVLQMVLASIHLISLLTKACNDIPRGRLELTVTMNVDKACVGRVLLRW